MVHLAITDLHSRLRDPVIESIRLFSGGLNRRAFIRTETDKSTDVLDDNALLTVYREDTTRCARGKGV